MDIKSSPPPSADDTHTAGRGVKAKYKVKDDEEGEGEGEGEMVHRDGICDIWGPRAPFYGENQWPTRVDINVTDTPDRW